MYRLEVYKLWLGFLEKTFLLILAVVVVPSVIGRIALSTLTVVVWAAIGIINFRSLRVTEFEGETAGRRP